VGRGLCPSQKIFGNFYLDVRCQKRPFLRVTGGRKRCNKQIIDLILKWRWNAKLVLTATSLAGKGSKDGALGLGGYKVKKSIKTLKSTKWRRRIID